MRMIRQSLVVAGVTLTRGARAFLVAPASVGVARQYSSVLSKVKADGSLAVNHAHSSACNCARCTGSVARAVHGLRMMSTDYETPAQAPVKLYIGNLGWDATTEDLQASFAEFGDMSDCYVVIDRSTGESRGFGFVSFATEEEANRAVAAMNGKEAYGRRMRVDISRPKGSGPALSDGAKLYIGNLGYETTRDDLAAHFSQHGNLVDITVVTDRDTGASRGFAFATYSSPAEAQAAVDALDGFEVDGRELRVNLSRPREERTNNNQDGGRGGYDRGDNRGGGGGGGQVDATKIFVGNLGWETTSQDLQEAFGQYGDLVDAKVISDRDTGNSRGFGFVTFQAPESAEKAITALDGVEMNGREIRVNISQPKKPRFQESYDNESW